MKLSSKGQVTIPAQLRQQHGFAPGDEVEVIDEGGVLRIAHKGPLTSGQRAVARLRGLAGRGPRTDEVMTATRGE